MANSKASGEHHEYATIDTAPAAGGYWTNIVSPRGRNKGIMRVLFFSVRETVPDASAGASVITPIVQFRCTGDVGWTDYNNDDIAFIVGDRKNIKISGGGVQWRAGVHNGDYTSGSFTLGFDW